MSHKHLHWHFSNARKKNICLGLHLVTDWSGMIICYIYKQRMLYPKIISHDNWTDSSSTVTDILEGTCSSTKRAHTVSSILKSTLCTITNVLATCLLFTVWPLGEVIRTFTPGKTVLNILNWIIVLTRMMDFPDWWEGLYSPCFLLLALCVFRFIFSAYLKPFSCHHCAVFCVLWATLVSQSLFWPPTIHPDFLEMNLDFWFWLNKLFSKNISHQHHNLSWSINDTSSKISYLAFNLLQCQADVFTCGTQKYGSLCGEAKLSHTAISLDIWISNAPVFRGGKKKKLLWKHLTTSQKHTKPV